MTELRYDLTTKDWVIIAKERAKRPNVIKKRKTSESGIYEADCPFCLGNEEQTPPEVAVYPKDTHNFQWSIRVIPNKFPILASNSTAEKWFVENHYVAMNGFGIHEVVIESPIHNLEMSRMRSSEIETIIRMYRDRYNVIRRKERIRMIMIFKNHGLSAGTSISHPHSQVIGIPFVPEKVEWKSFVASEHFKKNRTCLYCDINDWEKKSGTRLLLENDCFKVFHPYASHHPFETWVSPIKHNASFGSIDNSEIRKLGKIMQLTIKKINHALEAPDFNFIIHSAEIEKEQSEYLHWYIQIVPRVCTIGGFEIGSGIDVNPSLPEESAVRMKSI